MRSTVGLKIGAGFAVMLLLVVVLGITCVVSLQNLKADIAEIRSSSLRSSLAGNATLAQSRGTAAVRGVFYFGQEIFYQQATKEFNDMVDISQQLIKVTPPEKQEEMQRLLNAANKQRDTSLNYTMPIARSLAQEKAAGNQDGVQNWSAELGKVNAVMQPIALDLTKGLAEMKAYNDQLMEKSTQQAVEESAKVIMTAIGVIIIGILLCGIMGIAITRNIRGALASLLVGTHRFADGDWRDPVGVKTRDEIGELAEALNIMRANTIKLVRQISSSVENVAAASEQLFASTEQSALASNQVADSITEVAAGAAVQLRAIEKTTGVVQAMAANVQAIAANSGAVGESAETTFHASCEGRKGVDMVVSQMGNIKDSVGRSSTIVAKLGERSKEIGQIVDTIAGIAGQTNLLALNAAIEAARAGEQGRGFAVVAEEVRKLAEQSESAAKQIAVLIREIQEDTTQAVEAMTEGSREVQRGTEVVNASGAGFEEISNLIEQVSAQITGISAAINQVADNSQEIVSAVKDIDKISQNVVGHTETVSAATQEQTASSQQIASSSQSLAKLAEELRDTVSKFQV